MKKLSVIIVNYNVCHFLEQALGSVFKAMAGIDGEIIVVDNNSVDKSVEMIRDKFPEVILIENKKNTGFSKANNQGIKLANGEFILLLNPDTVVEEDTFRKCIAFMESHPEAGSLGVKMLDGKGKFLPESKRGLPSPWVAFYKIFGLSRLFPKSKKFGRYHLGYLDKDQTHSVEILSGAFMFLRKSAVEKVGLLDEDYFMYGEDIDYSYRIIKAGFKNYYFADTRIIHYKGESTKKTSINYVFIFYKAMIIFATKHFSNKNAWIFGSLINFAIYIRAGLAIFMRLIKQLMLPAADAAVIYTGMFFLKNYWEQNFKHSIHYYPPVYMNLVIPAYIFIWLSSVYLSGGYEKPVNSWKIFRGAFIGTVFISALSNFVDPYRFSKAIIILGGILSAFGIVGLRLLIHFHKHRNFNLGSAKKKRIIIVGNSLESKRLINLLNSTSYNIQILGYATPGPVQQKDEACLGSLSRIKEMIDIYKTDEIIFCSKDIPAHNIIECMTSIDHKVIEYKIVPDESNYIIGSSSKNKPGEFYTLNLELNIITEGNVRNKRLLDVSVSLVFLTLSPLLMWFTNNPGKFLKNILFVLIGKCTWVGFTSEGLNLPAIRQGIISPVSYLTTSSLDPNTIQRLNMLYAKDYSLYTDLILLIKSFRKLG